MTLGERHGVPAALLAPFEQQYDAVFAIDPIGSVLYVNPVLPRMLGFAVDEIEGHHIAEFVHPDDLVRAAEVVEALQTTEVGVGVTPAIYRIRCADGSWLPLEVNGASPITDGPLADWMVLVGRYSGDQEVQRRVVEQLTTGAPIHDVIELIVEFGRWRHPGEPYLIVYTGLDGQPAVVGDPPAVDLFHRYPHPDSPWALAREVDDTIAYEADDLPPALREAAAALGLRACTATPVPDPLQAGTAVIVAWSTEHGPTLSIHRYPTEQMTRALALVMQWRQHIAGLERAAREDSLTGLGNRSSFFAALDATSVDAERAAGSAADESHAKPWLVALLFVDLDDFKAVNDEQGHAAGDAVLVEVAQRLRAATRPDDVVARLGGDEFAVLCPVVATEDDAVAIAERVLALLRRPVAVADTSVVVGASIGIALAAPDAGGGGDSLMERADAAMYAAKNTGKNQWRVAHRTPAD